CALGPGNPFADKLRTLVVDGEECRYFSLPELGDPRYGRLPFSIRVLLESAVRNCDGFQVEQKDVERLLDWQQQQREGVEVAFKPARVLLQDFTQQMRIIFDACIEDAVHRLGGDPRKINPLCPSDLVVDHSVQVDFSRTADALERNQDLEFERNRERFQFLKWGSQALHNMRIVPPGSGIVHQVNLEFLGQVVFCRDGLLYPDSLVGADSHTTMINGLGVLGWGVGGIEAEAVMLGQATSMLLPEVVGYRLSGTLPPMATSTDLVLTITKHLRQVGVVGKFVEFLGPGVAQLSIADRATVSNMCPEYGATVGFFPVDAKTLEYMRQTGGWSCPLDWCNTGLHRHLLHPLSFSTTPLHSDVTNFFFCFRRNALRIEMYYALHQHDIGRRMSSVNSHVRCHGHVAQRTSVTCVAGAGLLAKKAVERGLSVAPHIKTSLSPGSGVVTYYLREAGVVPYLEQLGFHIVGYGCMTCIGNSGPLPEPVAEAIEKGDLVAVGVLSGNRNFEGRVHPHTRANYLASPLLVVAYAIAGTVDIDLHSQPLGQDSQGNAVFLRDIWPSREEIQEVEGKHVLPSMFREVYSKVEHGSKNWQSLSAPESLLYPWDSSSTYIKCPPFFETMEREPRPPEDIKGARVLLLLGDSVTTDHISPAGSIARNSPAARYLAARWLTPREFNSYGARRGNDDVMSRGTFANIRLVNKFLDKPGPRTLHLPSGEEMDIFDAAERYRQEGVPLVILAGKEYGSGSSRDWAAKGPFLLGVRVVLAESYERIHRSNLVGMGIVPLQYLPGQSAHSLGLTGRETFSVAVGGHLEPGQTVPVQLDDGRSFQALLRFDTAVELAYFRHGGILPYVLRQML
ncbi:RNA-binding translational regulator IRP, putative, partial [Ixodes scapularis]